MQDALFYENKTVNAGCFPYGMGCIEEIGNIQTGKIGIFRLTAHVIDRRYSPIP